MKASKHAYNGINNTITSPNFIMEKPKICFLTSSFPHYNGDTHGIFVYHLARHLSQTAEMRVVCPYYTESTNKKEVMGGCQIIRFHYFYPTRLQLITSGFGIADNIRKNPFFILQFPFYITSQFFTALKQLLHCNIIHTNWILSGFVGVLLKKITKKPLIITLRGSDIKLSLQQPLLKQLSLLVLHNADAITSVSSRITKQVIQLGIPSAKTSFIPNGVDTNIFKPRNKKTQRKKLKLPLDSNILLYVGRISKAKGIDILLESFAKLHRKHHKTKLYFIGDGDIADFKEKTQSLHLSDNVHFIGSLPQHEIAAYYSAADLFILPSLAEGRPNVVLEALASGTPVVTTDVGDVRAFMTHEQNGFIVPPGDALKLAAHMNKLLSGRTLQQKFSRAGLKTIKDHQLSWNRAAQQYLAVYKQLLTK